MADTAASGISRRSALRKIGAGAAVAWTAPAVVTIGARAVAAGSPPPCTGVWQVKAGQTVQFTGISIPSGAVDHDTVGYQLDGGALVQLYDKPCNGSVATPDVTIGPFPIDHTLLVYLEDRGLDTCSGVTCDFVYFSNNPNHALLSPHGAGCGVAFGDSHVCSCDPTCNAHPDLFGVLITVTVV
jgi:hypothetical protein